MNEYKVTITETLKKDVYIEAENQAEAEQKAFEAWRNSEYVLVPDNFIDVDFVAEDMVPKMEMSYNEMASLFSLANNRGLPPSLDMSFSPLTASINRITRNQEPTVSPVTTKHINPEWAAIPSTHPALTEQIRVSVLKDICAARTHGRLKSAI